MTQILLARALDLLVLLLKSSLGRALMLRLSSAIAVLANTSLTGAEKKVRLLEWLTNAEDEVAAQFQAAGGSLVNLAIEALVAKLKLSGGGQ